MYHTGLLTACEQDQNDGQRNCPKHVEFFFFFFFLSKNKFEKLVHLVGFIIRILIKYSSLSTRKTWAGNIGSKCKTFAMMKTDFDWWKV